MKPRQYQDERISHYDWCAFIILYICVFVCKFADAEPIIVMDDSFDIGRVHVIKQAFDEVQEKQMILSELSKPSLTDYSLLPLLYDVYVDVFRCRGQIQNADKVYHRKKFLLIAVFLYSPITLVGSRLKVGLRKQLAKLFNLSSDTPISDNIGEMLNDYNLYRDFRRDVDIIYKRMMWSLEPMTAPNPTLDF